MKYRDGHSENSNRFEIVSMWCYCSVRPYTMQVWTNRNFVWLICQGQRRAMDGSVHGGDDDTVRTCKFVLPSLAIQPIIVLLFNF